MKSDRRLNASKERKNQEIRVSNNETSHVLLKKQENTDEIRFLFLTLINNPQFHPSMDFNEDCMSIMENISNSIEDIDSLQFQSLQIPNFAQVFSDLMIQTEQTRVWKESIKILSCVCEFIDDIHSFASKDFIMQLFPPIFNNSDTSILAQNIIISLIDCNIVFEYMETNDWIQLIPYMDDFNKAKFYRNLTNNNVVSCLKTLYSEGINMFLSNFDDEGYYKSLLLGLIHLVEQTLTITDIEECSVLFENCLIEAIFEKTKIGYCSQNAYYLLEQLIQKGLIKFSQDYLHYVLENISDESMEVRRSSLDFLSLTLEKRLFLVPVEFTEYLHELFDNGSYQMKISVLYIYDLLLQIDEEYAGSISHSFIDEIIELVDANDLNSLSTILSFICTLFNINNGVFTVYLMKECQLSEDFFRSLNDIIEDPSIPEDICDLVLNINNVIEYQKPRTLRE